MQSAHLACRQRNEYGNGAEYVAAGDERAAGEQSAREISARVFYFVAEKRSGFGATERKHNRGHEQHVAEMHVRCDAGGRKFCGGAEAVPGGRGDGEKNRDRQPGADCAKIVQPLTDGKADDVQKCAERQTQQREQQEIRFIVRKRLPACWSYI